MLIAHLPAGYIFAKSRPKISRPLFGLILFVSVLPDFDLLWFYLIDGRTIHHHRYWFHIPAFWTGLLLILLVALAIFRKRWMGPAFLLWIAVELHLVLDTVAGGIMWLWPVDAHLYRLTTVPPTQSNFLLSFMFHWTFTLEILICTAAILLYRRNR